MIINQSNLTGIYKTFSTVFNQAFDGAPSQWPLVAMEAPSVGRSTDYKWLGDFPMMK
ncbi:MAG TPA: Mu-like prophage major head subunit gpT family protein, partial [Candidatus Hydrogenedentes bacterium]|nr:Mu-like prophage major head subunit gpT family protein [Candidatus Hydrogenedentota bacterium]